MMKIEQTIPVGRNRHYDFVVGLSGERWIGGAIGRVKKDRMFFVFTQICEGAYLGIKDRDRAIRLVGALAEDPEQSYGGIQEWLVPEALRGKPAQFRCEHCDRVGCDGVECREFDGQ